MRTDVAATAVRIALLLTLSVGGLRCVEDSADSWVDDTCDGDFSSVSASLLMLPLTLVTCTAPWDPACDDGDRCTLDRCLDGVCRHGPPPFAGCCNGDENCDDGNPCTADYCDADHRCVHEVTDGPSCCQHDDDCGPGGLWDDGKPGTLDYCLSFQCVHTPVYSCCGRHTDCDDGDFCTEDLCQNGDCVHVPREHCCRVPQECDDVDPCTLDRCVNHRCRYAADPEVPDCCLSDGDCIYEHPCLVGTCDLVAHRCVVSLDPTLVPRCCWTDGDCDDGNPYTVDRCVDHRCGGSTPGCGSVQICNDGNPCTLDGCDVALGECVFTPIMGCCHADWQCAHAAWTDANPCTRDVCNPAAHSCEVLPVPGCCLSAADCDDQDPCTTDICLARQCRHIQTHPSCLPLFAYP